jgi:hypothetical protein
MLNRPSVNTAGVNVRGKSRLPLIAGNGTSEVRGCIGASNLIVRVPLQITGGARCARPRGIASQ